MTMEQKKTLVCEWSVCPSNLVEPGRLYSVRDGVIALFCKESVYPDNSVRPRDDHFFFDAEVNCIKYSVVDFTLNGFVQGPHWDSEYGTDLFAISEVKECRWDYASRKFLIFKALCGGAIWNVVVDCLDYSKAAWGQEETQTTRQRHRRNRVSLIDRLELATENT